MRIIVVTKTTKNTNDKKNSNNDNTNNDIENGTHNTINAHNADNANANGGVHTGIGNGNIINTEGVYGNDNGNNICKHSTINIIRILQK